MGHWSGHWSGAPNSLWASSAETGDLYCMCLGFCARSVWQSIVDDDQWWNNNEHIFIRPIFIRRRWLCRHWDCQDWRPRHFWQQSNDSPLQTGMAHDRSVIFQIFSNDCFSDHAVSFSKLLALWWWSLLCLEIRAVEHCKMGGPHFGFWWGDVQWLIEKVQGAVVKPKTFQFQPFQNWVVTYRWSHGKRTVWSQPQRTESQNLGIIFLYIQNQAVSMTQDDSFCWFVAFLTPPPRWLNLVATATMFTCVQVIKHLALKLDCL